MSNHQRFTRPAWSILISSLLLALTGLLWVHPLHAGTISVDGTICTLPEAIAVANLDTNADGCIISGTVGGPDTLELAPIIHTLTTGPYDHSGATGTPSITSTIIITNALPIINATLSSTGVISQAIIERTSSEFFRLLHVDVNGNLAVYGVTLRYGRGSSREGGAIANSGTLTLHGTTIYSNTASRYGGIYNSGDLTIVESTIIANNGAFGGGIGNTGNLLITATHILSNTAADGGGVYNSSSGSALIANSKLAHNIANDPSAAGKLGGAIVNRNHLIIRDSEIYANVAYDQGGGLYNLDTAVIERSSFLTNTAYNHGGAIYSSGTLTITDSDLAANQVLGIDLTFPGKGGALAQIGGTANIARTKFRNNTAKEQGSAIYLEKELFSDSSTISIDQSCIVDNAGIAVTTDDEATIDASNNWWGHSSGPAGGSGTGDSIAGNVTFTPWLTEAPNGCSERRAVQSFLPGLRK